ncbi:MAG: hypothetical protein M3373_02855, partial [Gemmatimonadota bacterium]|nr:hypothetical protein [Gemmatimonadota bacterium]
GPLGLRRRGRRRPPTFDPAEDLADARLRHLVVGGDAHLGLAGGVARGDPGVGAGSAPAGTSVNCGCAAVSWFASSKSLASAVS